MLRLCLLTDCVSLGWMWVDDCFLTGCLGQLLPLLSKTHMGEMMTERDLCCPPHPGLTADVGPSAPQSRCLYFCTSVLEPLLLLVHVISHKIKSQKTSSVCCCH